MGKMRAAWEIFGTLEKVQRLNLPPKCVEDNCKPITLEAVKKLEKVMSELQGSQDGQTFAFGSEKASDVYWYRHTAVSKEFKFLKEGSDREGPDTKGTLIYEQFLPFNNQNHNNSGCVAVKDLPRFYKNKGKFPW